MKIGADGRAVGQVIIDAVTISERQHPAVEIPRLTSGSQER
jgi:hypothetical protein